MNSIPASPHPFILASGSPRRRELLEKLAFPFQVRAPQMTEIFNDDPPLDQALRLAGEKMTAAEKQLQEFNSSWILTADTLIGLDQSVLGKPKNSEEAKKMLIRLSGRKHQVITGFSLHNPLKNEIITDYAITDVTFAPLSDKRIDDYLKTEEWHDAAGAYKIQQKGALLVTEISGSYPNIVGLPITKIYGILTALNYPFWGQE